MGRQLARRAVLLQALQRGEISHARLSSQGGTRTIWHEERRSIGLELRYFPTPYSAAIFGMGGIGTAFGHALGADPACEMVHAFSRRAVDPSPGVRPHIYDPDDEDSLPAALQPLLEARFPNLVLVTVGALAPDQAGPEKSIRQFDGQRFIDLIRLNAVLPALLARTLWPNIPREGRWVFAALSARVGSISDNRLGGWHSYRASKAALNQLIRNFAIELSARNPQAIAVTLHPGTVDTALSRPFQKNVKAENLFTPQHSAERLLAVIDRLTPDKSGRCFDYAGREVLP
jgi:NAD(P)-dependent dehydrogenase (short-subunit alcohol dehydrogenase family)